MPCSAGRRSTCMSTLAIACRCRRNSLGRIVGVPSRSECSVLGSKMRVSVSPRAQCNCSYSSVSETLWLQVAHHIAWFLIALHLIGLGEHPRRAARAAVDRFRRGLGEHSGQRVAGWLRPLRMEYLRLNPASQLLIAAPNQPRFPRTSSSACFGKISNSSAE